MTPSAPQAFCPIAPAARRALAQGAAFAFLCLAAPARAQAPVPAASSGDVTSTAAGCTVRGTAVMSPSAKLYGEAQGDSAYARFTGAETALAASRFSSAGTRAAVRTGTGSGSFRVEGFVETQQLPVRTARDVMAISGHVWISAQQEVTVVGAAAQKLQVSLQLKTPLQQTFKAWAPCDALTFTQAVPSGWAPEGNARGYTLFKEEMELFDGANGDSVITLFRNPYVDKILTWSTERRGAWVHLLYHGPVVIDGWVRSRDLRALPRGETMDVLAPPSIRRGKPALRVDGALRSVRTTKELPLRIEASDSGKQVGSIEPGTDTLVIDIVAGWASVLPKSLSVVPDGGHQFWVLASDLDLDK